jgi:acyl carrier protein
VNLVEWDSLAVISAIALIDDYFHITVSTEDLRVCKSLAGLFALIELAKN